jgi:hypothetical protein
MDNVGNLVHVAEPKLVIHGALVPFVNPNKNIENENQKKKIKNENQKKIKNENQKNKK